MNVIEQFLRKVSYKFPKGYPDISDPKDMLMLEGMLKEMGITLPEANLGGTATGYGGQYGAFEKYVTDNNKHIVGNPNDIKYKAEKNTVLLDSDFNPSKKIKKGEVPNTIEEFINQLKTLEGSIDEFEDLYLRVRGTNEAKRGNSLVFTKVEKEDGSFEYKISDVWKSALGL